MFSKKFQRKYALTDQGLRNTKRGAFWTVIASTLDPCAMLLSAIMGHRMVLLLGPAIS